MADDEFWTSDNRELNHTIRGRVSPVRISFLFACGVIALSVMVTPIIAERTLGNKFYSNAGNWDLIARENTPGYDTIVTGSVAPVVVNRNALSPYPGVKKQFTIRRTITENDAISCVIVDLQNRVSDC